MTLNELMKTKGYKSFIAKLYSIGASIVVLGALFKIQHWPGSGVMLSVGLVTESIIFFFSAFEEAEEEGGSVDVYPQLLENGENGANELPPYNQNQQMIEGAAGVMGAVGAGKMMAAVGTGSSIALAKFDEMLDNADLSPELLQRLGHGIKKLGDTAENMNTMGDVSVASSNYIKTIRSADASLEKLARTYETVINKVNVKTVFKYRSISNSLSMIEGESRAYQQQMQTLNKNINALSTVYKMQKAGMDNYLNDLKESAVESKKYREQMAKLNENLETLNQMYGEMIDTMKQE